MRNETDREHRARLTPSGVRNGHRSNRSAWIRLSPIGPAATALLLRRRVRRKPIGPLIEPPVDQSASATTVTHGTPAVAIVAMSICCILSLGFYAFFRLRGEAEMAEPA